MPRSIERARAGERQERHRARADFRSRAPARCASDSRRASGGRRADIQRPMVHPVGGGGGAGPAGLSSHALSPRSPRGSAGNIRCAPCRGSGGSRSPVGQRDGRSGLPSPAATESPNPAISRSRTWISVERSRRCCPARDADRRDRGLAVAHARRTASAQDALICLRRDSAVVEAPVAGRAGRHHAGDRADRWSAGQIVLPLAVAVTGFGQPPAASTHRCRPYRGPAAAVGGALQHVLGGE